MSESNKILDDELIDEDNYSRENRAYRIGRDIFLWQKDFGSILDDPRIRKVVESCPPKKAEEA